MSSCQPMLGFCRWCKQPLYMRDTHYTAERGTHHKGCLKAPLKYPREVTNKETTGEQK